MSGDQNKRKPFSGDHAQKYDMMAGKSGWLDPDILLGLAYRYTAPGETLLDVGIGTGLASMLFHRAGLKVVGLDQSTEMLAVCREKGFADKLFEHDVTVSPYPLAEREVDHAISCGVLHVVKDLSAVIAEVGRVMKKGGVFVFAVAHTDAAEVVDWEITGRDGYPSASLYRHPLSYIREVGVGSGFELINSLRYLGTAIGRMEMDFHACVLQKIA